MPDNTAMTGVQTDADSNQAVTAGDISDTKFILDSGHLNALTVMVSEVCIITAIEEAYGEYAKSLSDHHTTSIGTWADGN